MAQHASPKKIETSLFVGRDGAVQAKEEERRQSGNTLLLIRWPFLIMIICMIMLGVIFMSLSEREAEQVMKRTMLSQARMLVESIDQERFSRLTATAADELSPDYQYLRDSLVRIRAANPTYRYLYLMGKQETGPPFFYMGTAPAGTDEYSPPGQLYPEEAPALAQVFLRGEATLSDPVTDRWGTWISALVPLRDRITGRMLAVFGMDIDASDWQASIRLRTFLPGALTLAIVFLLLLLFCVVRNRQRARTEHLLLEQNRLLEVQATELKQASEELQLQKDRYGFILEGTNLGTWEWNVQTGETIFNERFVGMAGYTLAELAPISFKTLENLVHPDDLHASIEALDRHFKGETDFYECECRIKHKDGHWVWVLDKGKVVSRTEEAKPLLAYGTHQDITERKRAEAALRVSEERFRGILQNVATVAVQGYALDGTVRYWNRASETFYGYTAEEALGRNLLDLIIPPAMRGEVSAAIRRMAEAGEAIPASELALMRKNGSRIPVYSSHVLVQVPGQDVELFCIDINLTERQQAEEALRASEERFRHLVENAPFGLSLMRPDQRFAFFNPQFTRIFGYTLDDVPDKRTWFLHAYPDPDHRKQVMDVWAEDLGRNGKTGEMTPQKFAVRCKDGRERTIRFRAVNLTDGSQILSYEDITDRKRAEAALREEAERFAALARVSNTGVWEWHHAGRYLWCSPEYFAMMGRDAADFDLSGQPNLEETWLDLLHPDDRERAGKHFADYLSAGSPGMYENFFRMRHRDGSWMWIWSRGSTLRDASGQLTDKTVGTHINITVQKAAEAEIVAQREQLQSIAANVPGAVFQLYALPSGEYGLTHLSGRAVEVFELQSNIDSLFSEFVAHVYPDDRDAFMASIQEAVVTISPWRYEGRFVKPSGGILWFSGASNPIRLPDRVVFNGFILDITERKQAEAELEILQTQLNQAQKMESVGRLAGGVAHDFNNMLGVILGHTEMALERVGPDAPLRTELEEVRKAAQRSADLTRQLLAFARKQTVAPKVLDLNQTVEGMFKLLRRLIGEDIDLLWKPGEGLWPVKVDPAQLDQILANLCVNARDAITGVGKVIIETDNAAFDESYCARHGGFVPGEYVLMAVSDDGCGMDAETVSHIFEPFFTTKEMGKGTGLGLATVYGAVRQNNGFVNVSSEPNQGTTFKIYLPRHTARAALAAEERRPQAARGSETILLVEDEPMILEMTTRMLERLGYVLLAARTPREALRMAGEHSGRIDLLMTDVVMPEMNGRELANNLLAIIPGIRRLFMSGYTANVIVHHGVLDEGVHFIQKPFSMKDLEAKIREALGNASA